MLGQSTTPASVVVRKVEVLFENSSLQCNDERRRIGGERWCSNWTSSYLLTMNHEFGEEADIGGAHKVGKEADTVWSCRDDLHDMRQTVSHCGGCFWCE